MSNPSPTTVSEMVPMRPPRRTRLGMTSASVVRQEPVAVSSSSTIGQDKQDNNDSEYLQMIDNIGITWDMIHRRVAQAIFFWSCTHLSEYLAKVESVGVERKRLAKAFIPVRIGIFHIRQQLMEMLANLYAHKRYLEKEMEEVVEAMGELDSPKSSIGIDTLELRGLWGILPETFLSWIFCRRDAESNTPSIVGSNEGGDIDDMHGSRPPVFVASNDGFVFLKGSSPPMPGDLRAEDQSANEPEYSYEDIDAGLACGSSSENDTGSKGHADSDRGTDEATASSLTFLRDEDKENSDLTDAEIKRQGTRLEELAKKTTTELVQAKAHMKMKGVKGTAPAIDDLDTLMQKVKDGSQHIHGLLRAMGPMLGQSERNILKRKWTTTLKHAQESLDAVSGLYQTIRLDEEIINRLTRE